jgi:hypothetical protein
MKAPSLAFPIHWGEQNVYDTGMLLRDYFAAAALSGFTASLVDESGYCVPVQTLANDCYELADAMMRARLSGE